MAGNGKKADYEAMGSAIAHALAPQFVELRNEIVGLRGEMSGLRGETRAIRTEIRENRVRLDQIVENTGGHYRRLDARVSRLESKIFPDETGG